MHPRVRKELAQEISRPLVLILNKSLNIGKIPENGKNANVVPLFKKGKWDDLINIRPDSLTFIPGKIVAKLIWDSIDKELKDQSIINVSQHGVCGKLGHVRQT